MIEGVTSSGFAFAYDERNLDDVRLVDVLAVACDPEASDVEKISSASKVVGMILGPQLKRQLYDFIGEKHEGRVPQRELEEHLAEIMAAARKDAEKN